MGIRPDRYSSFFTLAQNPHNLKQVQLILVRRVSPFAVLAPHGGGIEPGTSELAHAVAGDEFSLYILEGLRVSGNGHLHITSNRFDEPACLSLLNHSRTALVLHGCNGSSGTVHVGGLDGLLRSRFVASLREAGFKAQIDTSRRHSGEDPVNLCNRGLSGKGVQMEMDLAFRAGLFLGMDPVGRRQPNEQFHLLVSSMRGTMLEYCGGL